MPGWGCSLSGFSILGSAWVAAPPAGVHPSPCAHTCHLCGAGGQSLCSATLRLTTAAAFTADAVGLRVFGSAAEPHAPGPRGPGASASPGLRPWPAALRLSPQPPRGRRDAGSPPAVRAVTFATSQVTSLSPDCPRWGVGRTGRLGSTWPARRVQCRTHHTCFLQDLL